MEKVFFALCYCIKSKYNYADKSYLSLAVVAIKDNQRARLESMTRQLLLLCLRIMKIVALLFKIAR